MKAYKWILCIVLVAVFAVCILLFGNFKSDDSTLQAVSTVPASESEMVTEFNFSTDDFNTRLLSMINAYRAKYGLAEWAADENLSVSAATRAYECALLESKSHTRPDGAEWYTALGITENYNYSEVIGISGQAAEDLLRSWIESENINAGLLSPEYTACGIGCEAVGDTVYSVLILYKP